VTTKAEFLASIRAQMRTARDLFSASVAKRPEHPAAEADTIRRELAERWPATLEKFRVEFERVGGVFYRVTSVDEVPAVVGRLAHEREARGLVAWHAAALGADLAPALEARPRPSENDSGRSRPGPTSGSPASISPSPRPAP
jgi:L-lactate utilization protein LutB